MSPLRARRLWTARGRFDTTVTLCGALALICFADGLADLIARAI